MLAKDPDHIEIGTVLVHNPTHARGGARHFIVTGETRLSWLVQEQRRHFVEEKDGSYSMRIVSVTHGPEIYSTIEKVAKDTLTLRGKSTGVSRFYTHARVELNKEVGALTRSIEQVLKGRVPLEALRSAANALGINLSSQVEQWSPATPRPS